MRLGNECTVIPVCGVTCADCPAFDADSKPIKCTVMSAVIRAFEAQEDYWTIKIRREGPGV